MWKALAERFTFKHPNNLLFDDIEDQ